MVLGAAQTVSEMSKIMTLTHSQLVELGVRWAKKHGFAVAHGELSTSATGEIPDVVAFNSHCTIVIECKTSRSDYLIDKKKPWRQPGKGIGHYRFYLAPEGLITVSELPSQPRWGLIEVGERNKLITSAAPRGGISNLWPNNPMDPSQKKFFEDDVGEDSWAAYWHPSDLKIERGLLYSIARRKQPKI